MENSVSIPSSHLKYLIPGYRIRLEEISNQINNLEQERLEINKLINSFTNDSLIDTIQPTSLLKEDAVNYDPSWSWFSKAKFILKKEGKPLTTAQIVGGILSYESGIERALAIRNISSILGTKSREQKEIEKFVIEGKDQKFALK